MTADYFESKKTGGSKNSTEITVDVKAEKVMDFANEIRNAALDEVLEIIDDEIASWERIRDELGCRTEDDNAEAALAMARSKIEEELKGGEQE